MTREIKFRAWHKLKKRWFTGREILGYINIISNDDKYIAGDFLQIPNLSDYDFVFAQYTGLTDKNGKEVYEGDIVHGSYGIPPVGVRSFVEYENGCFMIKTEGHNPNQISLYEALSCLDMEVVGNIYENPELI